jgi:hypothetical protein
MRDYEKEKKRIRAIYKRNGKELIPSPKAPGTVPFDGTAPRRDFFREAAEQRRAYAEMRHGRPYVPDENFPPVSTP